MNDFFNFNFNINKITLAIYVAPGCGDTVHRNRTSHGLALYTQGNAAYTFEGSKTLTAEKNDIIFMPKHSNYTVDKSRTGGCYAINFDLSPDADFEPFVLRNASATAEKFKTAERAFRKKNTGYEMKCKSELYSILCSMLDVHNKNYTPKSTERIIAPALEYIHSNYTSGDISIEHLAKMCNVSPAYFRRIFSNCIGASPVKYINNLKIARAKECILSGFYSVSQISGLAGFNDESYFCRFFKSTTGMTPSEYRLSKNK